MIFEIEILSNTFILLSRLMGLGSILEGFNENMDKIGGIFDKKDSIHIII